MLSKCLPLMPRLREWQNPVSSLYLLLTYVVCGRDTWVFRPGVWDRQDNLKRMSFFLRFLDADSRPLACNRSESFRCTREIIFADTAVLASEHVYRITVRMSRVLYLEHRAVTSLLFLAALDKCLISGFNLQKSECLNTNLMHSK